VRALIILAFVLTACAPVPAPLAQTAAATPIPWTTASPKITPAPTPTVPPAPTGVRECESAELRAIVGHAQGATGWWIRPLVVGTIADSPCLLVGPTAVRFLRADGTLTADAAVASPTPGAPGWAVVGAQSEPSPTEVARTLTQAGLLVQSYGDCADSRYSSILLIFTSAHASTQGPDQRILGRCDAPGQNLIVAADPLWADPALQAPASSPRTQLAASLTVPSTARPGDTLLYVVHLTNPSDFPYSLTDCPWYIEWLGGHLVEATPAIRGGKQPDDRPQYVGFTKESYVLNCAVPEVPARGALDFAMELRVPLDAVGTETLAWELVGTNVRGSTTIALTTR
jgi:hypothetical protein